MNTNDYLSVAQFAKESGLSKAAAYGLLEQDIYRQYVQIDGGVKKVSRALLDILSNGGAKYTSESVENYVAEPIELPDEPEEHKKPVDYVEAADKDGERERLLAEIEYLRGMVDKKDRQIADFAVRFADLAQQAQQIAGQAQVLQLNEASKEAAKMEIESVVEPVTPVKRGFWSRLFGG